MSSINPRVISLIASATEILWGLGKGNLQVGRSHECDHPAEVLSLPQVTWTKFDTNGRSYDIDTRVKAIVQEGLSVYGVDAEKLKALSPDVILTQDHCQVCAVSLSDVESATCELLGSRPTIVSLHPDSLNDIWRDIQAVAAAIGDEQSGERLVDSLEKRINAIGKKLEQASRRPTIVFVEWIEPFMVGGNWAPEIIHLAGGEDLLGHPGTHSPQFKFEKLLQADPEIIIVAPCGFILERTRAEMNAFTEQPAWQNLRAVKADQVYIADGNRFFNRPGPSVVDSLEIIAEILHPELFDFGYGPRWWQKFDSSAD